MALKRKINALERRLSDDNPPMDAFLELDESAAQSMKWMENFLATHKEAAPLIELFSQRFKERIRRASEARG